MLCDLEFELIVGRWTSKRDNRTVNLSVTAH